jgi:HK97 family phage major capsid protein/HK97 family phage prohead protease
MGDIIEPLGITFTNPAPLLLYHNSQKPVGQVRFSPPTKDGLAFEAELPIVEEPGTVRDRIEEAWTSIKTGLLAGVSIGFRSLEESFIKETGSFHFLKTEVLELSLVAIPANAGATIQQIKSLDQAALGPVSPASGRSPSPRSKAAFPMKTSEQILQYENQKATRQARMDAIMDDAAAEGATLNAEQTTEHDALRDQVKSIDDHLVRLRDREKLEAAAATAITATTDPAKASGLRGAVPIITVKSNLPKGTAFTRLAMAMARAKGDQMFALEIAKQWRDSTPEVELYMKAAVAAGTTTATNWALPLVPTTQNITGEFIELLRPNIIIGKLPKLRKVPFNIAVPAQSGSSTVNWVGEGKPKPLSALAFTTVSLGFAKIAGIVVLTDELVRFSTPSAEELVRNDLIAGVSKFMDGQFIDPAVAAVVAVNPASITNGIAPIASSGTSADNAKTDIKALIKTFVTAELTLANAALIMSEANAFALSVALNPLGQPAFPGFGMEGGNLLGIPVVTSQTAGSMIILVDQQGILYADEGGTVVDVSREASLQMDSAPMSPTDATTVFVSLWQQNMTGVRVERQCTWARARLASVAHISGAAYV